MKTDRLTHISFMAMFGVVWWHCYCGSFVERWFIPAACYWSVPWFFFLSGVLFRKTLERKSASSVIKAKAKSLLVPYMLWCVIGYAITVNISDGGGVFDAFCFSRRRIHPWGNAALWYVRTLLVFMLVTGLISCIFKYIRCASIWAVPLLSFVLITACSRFLINLGPGSSAVYFMFGFVVSRWVLAGNIPNKKIIGVVGLATAVIVRFLWFALGYDFTHNGLTWLGNMSTVCIIISLLCLVDYMPNRLLNGSIMKACMPLTAFVYFMHYPVNDVIKYYSKHLSHDLVFASLIIIAPLLYLAIAYLTKKYATTVYGVLSGGR